MKKLLLIFLILTMLVGCGAPAVETPVQEAPAVEEPVQEKPAVEEPIQEEPAVEEPIQEEPAVEEPVQEEIAVEEPAEETQQEEIIPFGTFTAQTITGETVDESFFSNAELTVVNVWATYCGPCKKEMPVLGMLDRELGNVQVLGIVTDVLDQQGEVDPAQVEVALELHKAYECDYPSLILNEDLAALGFAGLSAVPATLFVDKDGNLVGQGFYGALDETAWRDTIAERLEMIGS